MMTRIIVSLFALTAFITSDAMALSKLTLAAEEHELYVSSPVNSSLLPSLVNAALARAGIPATLEVMRPAFLKSALTAGRIDGEFAAIDLLPLRDDYLYSDSYYTFELVAVSKDEAASLVVAIEDLEGQRVAVINRFANTPRLREFKSISWSRNPTTLDALQQLADKRTPFLLTSKLYANELNTLLNGHQRAPVTISPTTLLAAGVRIGLHKSISDAETVLQKFNDSIREMRSDGTYDKLLGDPSSKSTTSNGTGETSKLHANRYQRLIKNW